MKLVIGNKNYSSWSMRPWVLMKQLNIPFEEVKLRFDFIPGSSFYQALSAYSPNGKVPVLVQDSGQAVWDTLAIIETLAEQHPGVWPADARARAHARSACAELHSGFGGLRSLCPMNIDADLSEVGTRLLRDEPQLQADLTRLTSLWRDALKYYGGPFLFGPFSAADAFFAPVIMRITRYALPLPADCAAYAQAVCASKGVSDWVADAMAEKDFLDFEEPYRDVHLLNK